MISGRAWHDLPIVITLGFLIGLAMGQVVKLTLPEPTTGISQTNL
ncbi:hypothetical protein MicloDRAFT_00063180 [Microvirga lotononidis]|uniref:Uncharacterized protein n=1 Tax=Microvirga lotononidis TaxID=864069 RepID=I4YNP9_9HYPH|nr:hypothetical protein MicloDRAFT_00063180 [Microvirga lotononidis]